MKYCLAILLLIISISSCSKSDPTPSPNNNNNNNTDSSNHLNIKGVFKTCNQQDLTNGDLVVASHMGFWLLHINHGQVDTILTSNSQPDSISIWVIDMDSLTVSDTIRMAVTSDSVQLGTISACSHPVDEYIHCAIGQDKFVYVPILFDTLNAGGFDTLAAPTTYIYRSSQHVSNSNFYRMQFAGMTTGTFGVNWNSTFQMGRYYSFNMPSAGTVTYNAYENTGGYVQGVVNVPFIDNTDSMNYTLTGRFRIKRDY